MHVGEVDVNPSSNIFFPRYVQGKVSLQLVGKSFLKNGGHLLFADREMAICWLPLLGRKEVLPLILFSVCCSPASCETSSSSSSSSPLPEEFHIERISTPDRATKLLKDSAWKRDGILSAELKETSKLGWNLFPLCQVAILRRKSGVDRKGVCKPPLHQRN